MRLILATLPILLSSAFAAPAIDEVQTHSGQKIKGVIVDATGSTLRIRDSDESERAVRSRDVLRLRWGDHHGAAQEATKLLARWRSLTIAAARAPRRPLLTRDLRQVSTPATLQRLDRAVVARDPILSVPVGADTIDLGPPLLRALTHIRWVGTDVMLARVLVTSRDREIRRWAGPKLERVATARCLPQLAKLLASSRKEASLVAGIVHGLLPDCKLEFILAGLAPALRHDQGSVRQQAWRCLAGVALSGSSGADALYRGCRDRDPRVRLEVVRSLASSSNPEAIDLLLDLVDSDRSSMVVTQALGALARSSSFEVLPFLMELAERTEDDWCRRAALAATAKIAGVDFGHSWDRWQAWWELSGRNLVDARFDGPEPEDRLETLLASGGSAPRVQALMALADDREMLPAREILDLMVDRSTSPVLARACGTVLRQRSDLSACWLLSEELGGDHSATVGRLVRDTLRSITGADLILPSSWLTYLELRDLAADPVALSDRAAELLANHRADPALRLSILQLVRSQGLKQLVPEVTTLLHDHLDPALKRAAMSTLSAIASTRDEDGREAILSLLEFLSSDSETLQSSAVAALRVLSGKRFGADAEVWSAWYDEATR